MSTQATQNVPLDTEELRRAVLEFPIVLERLQKSYSELEVRAQHVEDELCRKVEELDEVRSHLEAVLESLPCGVVVRNADGGIVRVNAAAEALLGCSEERLQALGDHEALEGANADGEPREVLGARGQRQVLASHSSSVHRASGEVDGSVEILEDHTERAEMTERLHAADKMAALGTMAAGIAHEIRNPLNAVKGFAALLRERPREDEKARRWCRLIEDATSEADAIIESMLSFGSPERLRLERIDGSELVTGAFRLSVPPELHPSRVTFESDVEAFRADHIKLRQALRNLVSNAIEAQQAARIEPRVHVKLTREDDDVVLRVSDAGPGVAPQVRSRIFDPFFTDHPDGTGLGLALVSTIVRLHGGSVRVLPEPSDLGGADFVIRIPFQPVDPAVIHPQPSEG